MAEYTLDMPAPDTWLNSNDRMKWQPRHRLTRTWRHAGQTWALAALRRGDLARITGPVEIVAAVRRDTARGRSDAANRYPTVKAVVDGLVDAGVLVDDSDRYVTSLKMVAGPTTTTVGGRLVLTIREVTE
ncbi:hypothetical protein [Stackebrandtia soli]|uniref:hypothetical protein n=1 Tax=Stackebrandtia soli TaxID=1892856 RepID=UPI0039ECFCD5